MGMQILNPTVENLKRPHYNCAYQHKPETMQIVQTSPIKANEKLSIQYTSTVEYWKNREDYPTERYRLACERYNLPLLLPAEPLPPAPMDHHIPRSPANVLFRKFAEQSV
jgi:hypothetical protein